MCALSARLEVETRTAGTLWKATFSRGEVVDPPAPHGRADRSGARVRFLPDPRIFGPGAALDPAGVAERLSELAMLLPLLTIRWQGAILPAGGGPSGRVRELAGDALVPGTLHAVHRTIDDVVVDLALAWRGDGAAPDVRSYVNLCPTRHGGTHVKGLRRALTAAARRLGCTARAGVIHELLGPGLVAVLHVGLYEPSFGSPTRDQLRTPIAAEVVERALGELLVRRARPDLDAFLRARLGVPTPA